MAASIEIEVRLARWYLLIVRLAVWSAWLLYVARLWDQDRAYLFAEGVALRFIDRATTTRHRGGHENL